MSSQVLSQLFDVRVDDRVFRLSRYPNRGYPATQINPARDIQALLIAVLHDYFPGCENIGKPRTAQSSRQMTVVHTAT